MLEAATATDFEKLNNAIVRASVKGGQWDALAKDWQDRVVEERNWKSALPGLWASLLEEFWLNYSKLYRAAPSKTGLTPPLDVVPGGVSQALKDLWAPTVDVAKNVQAAVDKKIDAAVSAAQAKVNKALQAAGREAAKGAAQETTNYGAWAAGLGALVVIGYLIFRPKH